MHTHRTIPDLCPHCGEFIDGAIQAGGTEPTKPPPGALSLCLFCGGVCITTDELMLRKAEQVDLDAFYAKDPRYKNLLEVAQAAIVTNKDGFTKVMKENL